MLWVALGGVLLLGILGRIWSDRLVDRILRRRRIGGLYLVVTGVLIALGLAVVEHTRARAAWAVVAGMVIVGLTQLWFERHGTMDRSRDATARLKRSRDADARTARTPMPVDPNERFAREFILRASRLGPGDWDLVFKSAEPAAWHLVGAHRDRRAIKRLAAMGDQFEVSVALHDALRVGRSQDEGVLFHGIPLWEHKFALAERAASAIACRDRLSEAEFVRLYRPFAQVIPLSSLGLPNAGRSAGSLRPGM